MGGGTGGGGGGGGGGGEGLFKLAMNEVDRGRGGGGDGGHLSFGRLGEKVCFY